jgi:hypothetical protein
VLHDAFVRWGFPHAILSDRGSRFTAHQLHGGGRVLGPPRAAWARRRPSAWSAAGRRSPATRSRPTA